MSEQFSAAWWISLRDQLNRRFTEAKDSAGAVVELVAVYGRIPPPDRREVDGVLLDWLASEEENLRFDALAIVDEYGLREARPALRSLLDRLESDSSPGAPYEWAKVNRILGRLTHPAG